MITVWVVIAILSVLALAGGCYGWRSHKRLTAVELHLRQLETSMQRELDLANSAAIGVGRGLISIEKKLNGTMEKQQDIETRQFDYLPYDKAVNLAEHGADAEELVAQCGLSEAEAQLMARVKQQKLAGAV